MFNFVFQVKILPVDFPSIILFEDNHLLIVNKPSGMPSQGDNTGDTPLVEFAKIYIKQKYNKPGDVFCGLIHRIDRPVSGIVILAKTSKALARMNEIFKERQVTKTYWAVVKTKPAQESATLIHWLWRNTKINVTRAFENERKDTQRAELHYQTLNIDGGYVLLEVKPVTGRTHQIRSQLSSIKCSIVGDVKYGFPEPNPDRSIHLHARTIRFMHPVKVEEMEVTAPVPNESLWLKFESRMKTSLTK